MCQIAVKHPPHRQRRNSCQLVPDQPLPVCADGEVRIKGPVLLDHASPEEVGVCWHRPMKQKIPALTSVTTARCDPDYLPVTSVTTLDHCHAGKDLHLRVLVTRLRLGDQGPGFHTEIGRAQCREGGFLYVEIPVVAVS